jgi:hypothetical protein
MLFIGLPLIIPHSEIHGKYTNRHTISLIIHQNVYYISKSFAQGELSDLLDEKDKFKDTIIVIRSRNSKKDRQYNCQRKKNRQYNCQRKKDNMTKHEYQKSN